MDAAFSALRDDLMDRCAGAIDDLVKKLADDRFSLQAIADRGDWSVEFFDQMWADAECAHPEYRYWLVHMLFAAVRAGAVEIAAESCTEDAGAQDEPPVMALRVNGRRPEGDGLCESGFSPFALDSTAPGKKLYLMVDIRAVDPVR